MPDENTYYWLYNEGMTKFIQFKVKDQKVSILEYKIQAHHTLEEAGCPIEPIYDTENPGTMIDHGQAIWMGYVRDGWRMVDDKIGRIEQEADMETCWVTLNSTRKVNS